jgi:hypothetical protein
VDTRASGPGLERPEVDDFVGQVDLELPAHFATATVDQGPDIGGSRAASVDDEVAVLRRNERLALGGALEPGPVDQRAGRARNSRGHRDVRRGILEDATCARRRQRLRSLPIRE